LIRQRFRHHLLLFVFAALAVAAGAEDWVVFVNTTPSGASVTMDGRLLPGTTPLIVREPAPGEHLFVLAKAGYITQEHLLSLGTREATEIAPTLVSSGLSLSLPRNDSAMIAGNAVTAGDGVFQLSGDRFLISSAGGAVQIDPSPGLGRLADALNIATPIVAGFGVFLAVDSIARPPTDGRAIAPSVLAVHAVTVALIVLDATVNLVRARRVRDFRVSVEARGDPVRESAMMEDADEYLASGDLTRALEMYEALIGEFPTSDFVPPALHRSAGVQVLLGDSLDAERRYRRIVEEFPVAGIYDTSLKNLADLAVQQGNYEESLNHLGAITYFRSPYTREEILQYACEILSGWSELNDRAEEEALRILPGLTGRPE